MLIYVYFINYYVTNELYSYHKLLLLILILPNKLNAVGKSFIVRSTRLFFYIIPITT